METGTSLPTLVVDSPTPQASATPDVTFTLEPTITATSPSLPTTSPQPTMQTTSIPQPSAGSSAIQFYSPGPLSKLISPVAVYGYAIPGYGNKGKVFLYGEDGRILDSEVLQLYTAYTWAYYYWKLPFEAHGAGELGRLSMSTQDAYGRVTALNSVHLILLPEGFSIINPPGDLKERCVLEKPVTGKRIAGGLVTVVGGMRPLTSEPLTVELITRDGVTLASQDVAVAAAPDDSYVPFQVDLQYSLSTGTWALLSVSQADDRIPGNMYLYSKEFYLNP
jgi:hypothetical protein